MTNYTEDTKKNIVLHQQRPTQNLTPEVDRQGIQHYTLENESAEMFNGEWYVGKNDLTNVWTIIIILDPSVMIYQSIWRM